MLIGSVVLFLAVILFFVGILPSIAMAQQQQQTTTATTTPPPSSPLSITTTLPLTPEEQEQQIRLQNAIAATTANLNETEKQVSGIVYTPRWSEPFWVNANSIAVLIAYCLPGEFADSGQEILGGFGLEVLESYAVALPQGFMAWMAVVGNQDEENVRLPAALGVICASDVNDAESRILSPQEQQEINNINQQFSTIQNTQITNIDEVINIINNVTGTLPQNGTGGTVTEQPLRVEIITNATEAYVTEYSPYNSTSAYIEFDSKVTGGTEPYSYRWRAVNAKLESQFINATGFVKELPFPATFTFILTVTDSKGQRANDIIDINVIGRPPTNGTEPTTEEQPLRAEIITNATEIHRENGLLQVRAYTGTTIKFDASITGGTPPYGYYWMTTPGQEMIDIDKSITLMFFEPGTFTYLLGVSDSAGKVWSDRVQITIEERPGVLLPPETGQEGAPPGALLPGIAPGGQEEETVGPTEEGGESPSPETGEEGDTEEGGEETPPSPPDDTGDEEGGEEGGTPSSTEEEPSSPPGDGTGGG